MFNQRVVIVDVETTSLDPHERVVWDVGLVIREVDGTYTEQQFFVSLTQREIDRANPKSLDIGGFYERYNEYEALSKGTVAHHVQDVTRGALLAGICVDFDAVSLDNLLRSVGLVPEWDYHLVDIRTLAVGYLNGKSPDSVDFPSDQDTVADLLGIDPIEEEDRHTALGDAKFGAAMLREILGDDQ